MALSTLLDATTVNPEVLEAVSRGLISAKLNLPIPSLATSYAICQVLEGNFLVIRLPGMGKNCIARNPATDIFDRAEAAVSVDL